MLKTDVFVWLTVNWVVITTTPRRHKKVLPQEMFWKLCSKLRPYIEKIKGFEDPISVEKQVSVTSYYFVDEGRMGKVANSFGIGKSTISKIIRRVLFLL